MRLVHSTTHHNTKLWYAHIQSTISTQHNTKHMVCSHTVSAQYTTQHKAHGMRIYDQLLVHYTTHHNAHHNMQHMVRSLTINTEATEYGQHSEVDERRLQNTLFSSFFKFTRPCPCPCPDAVSVSVSVSATLHPPSNLH